MKKQVALCTLGTIFEWYEFSLFACMTPVLSDIFFPKNNYFTALMATFAIFASGYIMRPLGAIFFGQLGDRVGRKRTLVITIFTMTIATTAIGLIPTGFTFATVALVICRLAQGFATSGEYPGGLTLLAEQAHSKHSAFVASFGIFGTGAGCFAGALVYFVLLDTLSHDQLVEWGWRIPFLVAAPLGIIGYLLRLYTLESPEFESFKQKEPLLKIPFINLMRSYLTPLLTVLSISILTNTVVYINFLYFGAYLVSIHKLTIMQNMYLYLMVTFVYSLAVLSFGFLSDKIDKKKLLVFGCLSFTLSIPFLFHIIMNGDLFAQFVAQALISILVGIILGPFASILPEQFPTGLRYTGVSVTLNCAAAFFGGTAPLACGWLIKVTGSTFTPAFYLVILGSLASCCGFLVLTRRQSVSFVSQLPLAETVES